MLIKTDAQTSFYNSVKPLTLLPNDFYMCRNFIRDKKFILKNIINIQLTNKKCQTTQVLI